MKKIGLIAFKEQIITGKPLNRYSEKWN